MLDFLNKFKMGLIDTKVTIMDYTGRIYYFENSEDKNHLN